MSKENYKWYFDPHTCTSVSWQKHLACACQQFLCIRGIKVLWSRLHHHCAMTWIRRKTTCISLRSIIKVRLTQRLHCIVYHLKRKGKKPPLQEFCASEDSQWGSYSECRRDNCSQSFLPRKTGITVRIPQKTKLERRYLWYQRRQSRQWGSEGLSCLFGVEAPSKPPTSRPSSYCFKKRVMFSLAAALIAWMGSHVGTSQRPPPLPFPSTPSSCHALRCVPWQDVEIPLTAPPAQPGAPLLQDHVCSSSLPDTIPGCICASLLCV